MYSSDGAQLGETNVSLTPEVVANGRVILTASDLETSFGVAPWSGPAMLKVKGSAGFDLMTKLQSSSGLVSNTNCVRENAVHNIEGTTSTNQTFIRFFNLGNTEISGVKGTLFNAAGNAIGTTGVTLLESLAPRAQVFLSANQLQNLVGEAWDGVASLVLSEEIGGLKLLNLNKVNNETFFNFSCFETSESQHVFLMTNSASPNVSETHVINTSLEAVTFTGSLYAADGSVLGIPASLHADTIAPNGRIVLSASDLEQRLSAPAWTGPAILKVEGANSFALMTRLTSPSSLTSNTNCVRQDNVHNIEGTDSENQSFVRLINQGSTTIGNIVGTLYDVNGNTLGKSDTLLLEKLSPYEAVWFSRASLAALFETWTGEATLVVSGDLDADLRLLNLNKVNDETFFNFSCYERGQ